MPEPEDALARLERSRKESGRLYNDALTALDRALPERPSLPHPPPGLDDHQVHPLNKSWRIASEADIDLGSGWRRRLRKLVWDLIGPILQRQERFNAVLVEHVNRNHPGTSSSRACLSDVIAALDQHLEALTAFHSRLIRYLQQITLYVDTKDRRQAGQLRHELSLVRQSLSAGLDSVTDEFRMRLESALVFDRRMAADIERFRNTISEGLDDLVHTVEKRQGAGLGSYRARSRSTPRTSRSYGSRSHLITAATHTMKRELERLGGAALGARRTAWRPGRRSRPSPISTRTSTSASRTPSVGHARRSWRTSARTCRISMGHPTS